MKKFTVLLSLLVLLMVPVSSNATVYTFQPDPQDIYGLPHHIAVEWGMNWAAFDPSLVTGATLTFHNISNWIDDPTNTLYVSLLQAAAPGLSFHDDSASGISNYFPEGPGVHFLGSWSDPNGAGIGDDVTFTIASDYYAWLASGNFGFGIDPDCHFWNDGVELTITTSEPVPEPATLLLLGFGFVGLAAARKRAGRK